MSSPPVWWDDLWRFVVNGREVERVAGAASLVTKRERADLSLDSDSQSALGQFSLR